MAGLLRRFVCAGGLCALALSVPAGAVAQAAHRPAENVQHRVPAAWRYLHWMRTQRVTSFPGRGYPARAAGGLRLASPGSSVNGVADLSASNVWGVGYACASGCGTASQVDDSLIVHWNGTAWSQVPSHNPSASFNELNGVAVTSASDAWAVGEYCASACGTATEVDHTLILHWNGSTWARVASPSPGTGLIFLTGVSATSATSAWAVGFYSTASGVVPLILHWNGTKWSATAAPALSPGFNVLEAVAAVSASNAWAVGHASGKSLLIHWNGTSWARVPSPNPGADSNVLNGVSARSAKDIWAVGNYCGATCTSFPGPARTLILHWNGRTWSTVTSPNPTKGGNFLNTVKAVSASDAWAAGSSCISGCGLASEVDHTVILHWNGSTWTRVPSPNGGGNTSGNGLSGLAASSPADAWAVGSYCSSGCGTTASIFKSLTLHWNGTIWSVK